MPSVSRPQLPFVGSTFDPRTRLGDYARQSGRDTAESIRRGGALSAQMWSGIGENISGTLRDIAAYPDQQRARQRQETLIQRDEQSYQDAQQAKQAEQAKAQRLQELVREHGGRVPSERLLQEFGPVDAADISKEFDAIFPKPDVPKAPEPFTLNPGDTRFDGSGKPIANVPKPEPVVAKKFTTPQRMSDGTFQQFEEGQIPAGSKFWQEPKTPSVPSTPDQAFVIRNGQVTPITKGTAQAGDVPYSADAMQGMGGEASDARSMRTAAALNSIDVLKELAPKRMEGPPGMVQGALESVKGNLGYNTQVKQYNALLGPTSMQMAVAIQGAAGLSNAEREVMKGMLGSIATMDYQSQVALLERASELVRGGADVALVPMRDPKTGQTKERWAPVRSRMPGSVTIGAVPGAVPSGFSVDNPFAPKPKS